MIAFIGSSIVDIILKVNSDFLHKYSLKSNTMVAASEIHDGLFRDVLKLNPHFEVGGSTTNTARVCQWISKIPKFVTYIGMIGYDLNGKFIQTQLAEENIVGVYAKIRHFQTDRSLVLSENENRTLITDLHASKMFTLDHLKEDMIWNRILECQYIYFSAFFLRVSYDCAKKLLETSREHNKRVAFNLGATFMCENYSQQILEIISNVDLIFGNNEEILSLINTLNIEANDSTLEESIQNFSNSKTKKSCMIVVTSGDGPVIVVQNKIVYKFEVPLMKNELIVDTSGAGDAFAGAFLSKFIHKENLETCVTCGIWAAQEVIQNFGCKFDSNKEFIK